MAKQFTLEDPLGLLDGGGSGIRPVEDDPLGLMGSEVSAPPPVASKPVVPPKPVAEPPTPFNLGEDVIAPTTRLAGAAVGSALAFPAAGLAAITQLVRGKGLVEAGKAAEYVASLPAKILKSPAEEKALEMLGWPFHAAGAGWRGLVELASTGDLYKAGQVVKGEQGGSNVLVPLAGTIGELSAVMASPGKIKETMTLRKALKEYDVTSAELPPVEIPPTPPAPLRETVDTSTFKARENARIKTLMADDPLGLLDKQEVKPVPVEEVKTPVESAPYERGTLPRTTEATDVRFTPVEVEPTVPKEPVVPKEPIISKEPAAPVEPAPTADAATPPSTPPMVGEEGRLAPTLGEGGVPPTPSPILSPKGEKGPLSPPVDVTGLEPSTYTAVKNRKTGEVITAPNLEIAQAQAWVKWGTTNQKDLTMGWVRAPEGKFYTDLQLEKQVTKEQLKAHKEWRKERGITGPPVSLENPPLRPREVPVETPPPAPTPVKKVKKPVTEAPVEAVAPVEPVVTTPTPVPTPAPSANRITAVELDNGIKLMKKGATPEEVAKANGYSPTSIVKTGEFRGTDWVWDEVPQVEAPTPTAKVAKVAPDVDLVENILSGAPGWEAALDALAKDMGITTKKRGIVDTLKDVGTVLGAKTGLTIEDVAASGKRKAAVERLRGDWERMSALADSEMMDVKDYLKSRGFNDKQIASMELAASSPAPKQVEVSKAVREEIAADMKEKVKADKVLSGDPEAIREIVNNMPQVKGLKGEDSLHRFVEKEVISSWGAVIARETPAGREMIDGPDGIQKTFNRGERRGGEWEADYLKNVKDLTTPEKRNMVDLLEKPEMAPMNAKVKAAAVRERARLDEVAKAAGDGGLTVLHPKVRDWTIEGERGNWRLLDENRSLVESSSNRSHLEGVKTSYLKTPFHERENYFPRMVKREVVERRIEEAIDHLIKTGQVEKVHKKTGMLYSKEVLKEIARSKITSFMRRNSERRYGNLQIAREMDLPEWAYEHNPDVVLPLYYAKSGMRVEQAKSWGAKDQKLYDRLSEIAKEGGDREHAQRLLDRILFKEGHYPKMDAFVRGLTAYQVITKMGLSSISQVTQRLSAAVRTNMKSAVRAQSEMIRRPEEAKDWFIRSGSGVRGVSQMARNELTGSFTNVSDWFLQKNRFTEQDIKSRMVANLSGRFYAEHIVDKLKANPGSKFASRRLKQMDISPEEVVKNGFRLTEEQRKVAGQKVEIDSNFRNRAVDLPPFWTTRWGRIVTQFNTFVYSQTKFLREHVVKEAIKGNPLPMLYILGLGQISGEAVNDIRALITGKDRTANIPRRVLENLAITGAIGMFDKLVQTTKFGEPPWGATANTVGKAVKGVSSLVQGNWKPLAKSVVAEVPFVGQRLKDVVSKATEKESTKTKREKEERYWKQHPWSLRGIIPGKPPAKGESGSTTNKTGGFR